MSLEEREGLPEGWVEVELSEMTSINMGQSPDSSFYNTEAEGMPFFQGKAEFGKDIPTVRKWCSEPTKIASEGSVLLSVRAPIGPTNFAPFECCIGRGLAAINGLGGIENRFIRQYIRNIEVWLAQQGTGTTFTAVGGDFLRTLLAPLPPLAEQVRIADKLDALLSRVEAGRERLERVPKLLKRFRQSVLSAAVSGELTREWRGGGDAEWGEVKLDSLAESITDGDHQAPPQSESGIPFITISAINDGTLRLDKSTRFVPQSYLNSLKSSRVPKLGDILFSVTGSICIPALVDIEVPFVFQRHIAIIKPKTSKVLNKYLFFEIGRAHV